MLKRNVRYIDYNGNDVVDTFYFNLTKSELLELEISEKGGLGELLKNIIASQDPQALVSMFKKIILLAYGEKSEDGKRFIKNETMREEFAQTAAYDALFLELASDDRSASEFIRGIIPTEMSNAVEMELKQAAIQNSQIKQAAAESVMPPPPPSNQVLPGY